MNPMQRKNLKISGFFRFSFCKCLIPPFKFTYTSRSQPGVRVPPGVREHTHGVPPGVREHTHGVPQIIISLRITLIFSMKNSLTLTRGYASLIISV